MTKDEEAVLSCAQQIQQYCAEHDKGCRKDRQYCIFWTGIGNPRLLDETPELWCLEMIGEKE